MESEREEGAGWASCVCRGPGVGVRCTSGSGRGFLRWGGGGGDGPVARVGPVTHGTLRSCPNLRLQRLRGSVQPQGRGEGSQASLGSQAPAPRTPWLGGV